MKKEPNIFGITSLILGIVAILFSAISNMLTVTAGLLGLAFAIEQRKIFPNRIATGGLVTSIIGLSLKVIFWMS